MAAVPHDITDELIEALRRRGAAAPVIDGRRLRAERGRAAVVAATLRLVDRGDPVPTYAEIARESGVSERTVFRYFPDREALFGAVATEVFPRIAHCLAVEPPAGDVRARVEVLVGLRMELAERTAGLARSVERLAPTSELGAALLALRTDRVREQVDRWFADELSSTGPDAAALVDALLIGPSVLRLVDALGAARARSALVDGLLRLLAPL